MCGFREMEVMYIEMCGNRETVAKQTDGWLNRDITSIEKQKSCREMCGYREMVATVSREMGG